MKAVRAITWCVGLFATIVGYIALIVMLGNATGVLDVKVFIDLPAEVLAEGVCS